MNRYGDDPDSPINWAADVRGEPGAWKETWFRLVLWAIVLLVVLMGGLWVRAELLVVAP